MAPPPKSSEYAASNLISNLDNRSSGNDLFPKNSPTTSASHHSCYKTTDAELSLTGNILEITFDLGASYFQHVVVIVQDLYAGLNHITHSNINEYF